MANIAELVIGLRANTASFAKDLLRAKNLSFASAKDISVALSKIGPPVIAAAAAAAGAVTALVLHSARAADEAIKTARATGTTVESFTALAYHARLSGLANEDLRTGLQRLSRTMYDAASGLAEPKRAFDILKISVADSKGQLRDTTSVLKDVADRFDKMPDGPTKTALSMVLLGRSGANMATLLKGGSKAIQEAMNEAKEFGQVISTDTAVRAEQFNDNISRLKSLVSGLGNTILAEVAPALDSITDGFVASAKGSDFFKTAAQGAGLIVKALGSTVILVKGIVGGFGTDLKNIGAIMINVLSGDWKGAVAAYEQFTREGVDVSERTLQGLETIWDDAAANIKGKSPQLGSDLASPIIVAQAKVDKKKKEIQTILNDLVDEVRNFGATPVQVKVDTLVRKDATDEQVRFARAVGDSLEKLQQEADLAKKINELAASVREEIKAPDEKINEHIGELKMLLDKSKISADEFRRALEKLGALTVPEVDAALRKAGPAWKGYADGFALTNAQIGEFLTKHPKLEGQLADLSKAAQNLGKQMQDAFTQMIIHGQGFGDVLKNLLTLIEEAIIRIYVFQALGNVLTNAGKGGGFFGSMFTALGGFFSGLAGKAPSPAPSVGAAITESGGFMAAARGAHLTRGQLARTGEAGFELFAPDARPLGLGKISVLGAGGPQLFVAREPGRVIPHEESKQILRAFKAVVPGARDHFKVPAFAAGGRPDLGAASLGAERGFELFVPDGLRRLGSDSARADKRPIVFAPVYNIATRNPDSFRRSQDQILSSAFRAVARLAGRNG